MHVLLLILLSAACCGEDEMGRQWPGRGPNPGDRRATSAAGVGPGVDYGGPPDEYEVAAGQWGVDIRNSFSEFNTGDSSVHFPATSLVTGRLHHDRDHQVPVQAGLRYVGWVVFKASKNDAGSQVHARVEWMAQDRTTMIGLSVIYNAAAAAVNTWERRQTVVQAPSGAYFARIHFGIDGTPGFDLYIDDVDMKPAVPLWNATLPFDDTMAGDGSSNTVPFSSVVEAVDVSYNTTTREATILVPGFYFLQASIPARGLIDGARCDLYILRNGSTIAKDRIDDAYDFGGGGDTTVRLQASRLINLNVGDVIKVNASFSNGGGFVSVDVGEVPFFSGTRIM